MEDNRREQNDQNLRDQNSNSEKENASTTGKARGGENVGSNQQHSLNRGMADMDADASIGTDRTTRGSGISTKRSVTGSDYDGQLSGE